MARLVPAGVFYVNLRGCFERGATRTEILRERERHRQRRYQHTGRFDFRALPFLDSRRDATEGTQFRFRLNADGQPHAGMPEAMRSEEFGQMLDRVEAELASMGREILQRRDRALTPTQRGRERACDKCLYQAICRFDPWVSPFRPLK